MAWSDRLRNALIAWIQQCPAVGWLAPMLFGTTGATLAVALMRRYTPETSGSGIPQTKAVLYRLRERAGGVSCPSGGRQHPLPGRA